MTTQTDEPLPQPDDDSDNSGIGEFTLAVADVGQGDGDDDDGQRHPVERVGDSRRDEIVALYRQQRDKGEAEAQEGEATEEDDESSAAEQEPPQQEIPEAAAAPPAEQEIELLVDGKPVKKSLEEVKRLAQINLAADTRLDEAKRLLREAREVRQEHQPAEPQRQASPPQGERQPEHQPAPDLDPDALTRIVERIQVGDAEEGCQALTELVGLVRNSANGDRLTPEQVDSRVRQALVAQQTQAEIDAAAKAFEEQFPQIAEDQDFRLVGLDLLAREIRADLKGLGLSDDDLRPLGSDVRLLATAHRTAKANGANLRSYHDVFKSVGNTIATKFNLAPKQPSAAPPTQHQSGQQPRTPAATAAERDAQKRAALQQPRTAGMRRPATPSPQNQRPKTAAEKVEEMRAARGFGRTA